MIEKFKKEFPNQDVDDLANFIDDNWKELTGLTNRDKDEEGEFPDEVIEMIDELDIDYDDFCQEWNYVREGAEDWDDEDEDE